MPPQFIFEMHDVGKRYGERVVLKNISLSFYYGAKIGIVGENGSGKSTLLRIMAGIDTDIDGTAALAKNMRVRYVAQEPQLGSRQDGPREPADRDEADPGPRRSLQRDHPWRWPIPRRTTTSTSSWRRWAACRRRSTPATAGSSTA